MLPVGAAVFAVDEVLAVVVAVDDAASSAFLADGEPGEEVPVAADEQVVELAGVVSEQALEPDVYEVDEGRLEHVARRELRV
jgi:hypothetical protein